MATKITEYRTDDLETLRRPGAEVKADGTVHFSFEGTEYAIDLTSENKEKMLGDIGPYIKAARRLKSPRKSRARERPGLDLAAVRLWARNQGFDVKTHGRVPARIVEKYRAAHPL